MTKIAQIVDRSAASAWSPIASQADVIAIGGKVGRNNESSHILFVCYRFL